MSDNHDWWQGRSNQSWQDDEWSSHYSDQRWFSSDWSQGHWDVESSWNHTPYFSRRSSWTTWSVPHSEHDWQEKADSGRWWNTPKGRCWGDTLDEAVEWAVKHGSPPTRHFDNGRAVKMRQSLNHLMKGQKNQFLTSNPSTPVVKATGLLAQWVAARRSGVGRTPFLSLIVAPP